MRLIFIIIILSMISNVYANGKYSSDKYVICDIPESEYKKFVENEFFVTKSLAEEGFIHCASPSQLEYVMNKYFKGDSYRLFVSTKDMLGSQLRYEGKESQNLYPHLYRPFYKNDLIKSMNIKRSSKGKYVLPSEFKRNQCAGIMEDCSESACCEGLTCYYEEEIMWSGWECS